ncbi:MAG: HEAT repeat domain-containing protein [Deltaproteobacteria bacterium]|nr:HEAT repeat domain-containing protein [Deltaproteobacteria bacterium]MBW2051507.1 HEAT repeat domain-containing protein [Deltaproteobacteria bacterium]MBW2323744.1 HEAT repeat domain-containing protein [Deltaproteobacteria bacterium]
MKNYYQLLGVAQDAESEEISKAFRALALHHHPDIKGGNGQRMREINEAYEVLSHPARRLIYDRETLGFARFPELDSSPSRWFNPRRRKHLKAMLLNRKAGLRQMPFLMEAIAQSNPETCYAIKDLLVCYGSQAAVYLQAYLAHPHECVRYFAILAINEIGHRPPEHRLINLLSDSSSRIRAEVIHALAELKAEAAIPHLKKAMADEVMTVRLSAVETLETLGGSLAAKSITYGLLDAEARVREAAATALGHLGQTETIVDLRKVLDDPSPYVHRAARQAIRRLQAQSMPH